MSYILFLGTIFCFLLELITISIAHFDKVQFSHRTAIPEEELLKRGIDVDTPFKIWIILIFVAAVTAIVPIT